MIKVEEKLNFFLYMLSHNAPRMRIFKCSLGTTITPSTITSTTSLIRFNKVILILFDCFVQPRHPNQVYPKIKDNPTFYPLFKNCVGAIDRTHIPIFVALEKHSPFRNRKGTLSINMMVACDFDLNFTFISSGWEGSARDSRFLRLAMSKGFQVPLGKFYLVDGGYENTPSFLAPYRGV